MDPSEASTLMERCLPDLTKAGLPATAAADLGPVKARLVARLWGGMGYVYELTASPPTGPLTVIAKRVRLPDRCESIGDQRKKASYEVEAAFYANGHAVRLRDLGCHVPFPLYVERARADGVTIVMTNLPGRKAPLSKAHAEAALEALAVLHAAYWGSAHADAAAGPGPGGGLQRQGTYWHLDTRPDEHEAMPRKGWEGRLRLAARAIDERLKADPLQTVCHGDPKDDNMLFAVDGDKVVAHLHDFQYCGKGTPTKDLAYFFICASEDGQDEGRLLEAYHRQLTRRLQAQGDRPPALEVLRETLALSYCDLGRWMSGWGWWGHDLEGKIRPVLDRLDGGRVLESEDAYRAAMRQAFPVPQDGAEDAAAGGKRRRLSRDERT